MRNVFIFIVISIAWFVFSGVFIAERVGIGNWAGSLILYSMGFYWIFPYTFSKEMFFPYNAEPITAEEDNNGKRMLLFLLGLMYSSFISVV